MQDLQARLSDKGFYDISFRIINAKSSFNDINETGGADTIRRFAGKIPVIQEPEDMSSSWQTILDGGTDHVLVLDRCGRLAYQVISPWSLLAYPYVKAAILSTINDDPCGFCNTTDIEGQESYGSSTYQDDIAIASPTPTQPQTTENMVSQLLQTESESVSTDGKNETHNELFESYTHLNNGTSTNSSVQEVGLQIDSNNTSTDSSNVQEKTVNAKAFSSTETGTDPTIDNYMPEAESELAENELDATLSPLTGRNDGSVPVRVIMRFPHKHRLKNGTLIEHEYLVLQTGNPNYHGHLETQDEHHERNGRKHQNTKQTIETEENIQNTSPKKIDKMKLKLKKYHKKYKQHTSEEANNSKESNEEKSREAKKQKGKKKTNKGKSHNSMEMEGGSTSIERLQTSEESRDNDSTSIEEKIKHKGWGKYQSNEHQDTNEDDTSSSEVSQDIRKHDKHSHQPFDNNTLHNNRINHIQKSGQNHNIKKIIQISVGDGKNNNTRDHIRRIKVNKIIIGANRNDSNVNGINTQAERENNIKNIEVHIKKYYQKKARISVSESIGATPVPIPIVNKSMDNAETNKTHDLTLGKNRATEKLKTEHRNMHDIEGNENRLDDDDDDDENDDATHQRIEEIDLVTNSQKTSNANKGEEETSEENDDVRGENVVQHYSKLLKWIEYPL